MEIFTNKPYVAHTKDGDYFFYRKKQAQTFARARNGFFDTTDALIKSELLKGGDAKIISTRYLNIKS